MIAATYNCGCPIPKRSSSIVQSIGARPPCSPCCPRPLDASRRGIQSETVETSKRIRPISRDACCVKCISFRCAASCPGHTSSRRLSSMQCTNCCATMTSGMRSIPSSEVIRAATTRESNGSIGERYSRSESETSLRKLGATNAAQTPTDKIVSEIARRGQSYKEIEAVINDNRVIVRMHKEPVKEEYDPPCECIGRDAVAEGSDSSLRKCDNGAVFEMADGSLELCHAPREDARLQKKTYGKEETDCRTITLYPQADVRDSDESYPTATHDGTKERDERSKVRRSNVHEENPNIFLLRIRKRCESGDKRHKIDLEFRAPRPWLPRRDKNASFKLI